MRRHSFFRVARFLLGIMLYSVSAGALPAAAQQDCSRCTQCDSPCSRSAYGGNGRTFIGGCCQEIGGNCNPQLATLIERGVVGTDIVLTKNEARRIDPEDSRLGRDQGALVRVTPSTLVDWDCTGEVRALYWREGADDMPVASASGRYALHGYLTARSSTRIAEGER